MKLVKIAVFPASQFARYQRLLDTLAQLYSLQFESRAEGDWAGCAAGLFFGTTRIEIARAASAGLRCIGFVKDQTVAVQSPNAPVSFASTSFLPKCLRGRAFADQSVGEIRPLQIESGDEIIAQKGKDLLWIHKDCGEGSLDLLALDVPDFADGKYAYEYLQRDNCLRLLPIVQILRDLSPWKRPSLRAQFMFDDPNLHWKSYGFIQFKKLARHAATHNYHASFATVPFDAWYVNSATAKIFREHKERLSLLVHGNNHTYAELAQSYANGKRQESMAQAMARIDGLQNRSGVEVPYIMAAPHGGCSFEMANALLQVGFEAACMARWSLTHFNPNHKWGATFDLNVAEFFGGGFPIIPRFKLAKEREIDIYLTALLEKPIIMVGHHDDLRGGLDYLAEFAERINSLGAVEWRDMKSIARSNFYTHSDEDTLRVKTFSRRFAVRIPAHVKNLFVERAWLKSGETEALHFGSKTIDSYRGEPISVAPCSEIEITCPPPGKIDRSQLPLPAPSLWAALRRGFCEARDRSQPALKRIGIR